MLTLSNLSPSKGARKQKKRLGRGPGSGHGKTAARGYNGAKSRSGSSIRPGFEGGQMPMQRRLPKVGFKNIFKKVFTIVSLTELNNAFDIGATVDKDALVAAGMIRSTGDLVKVLANGELDKKMTVKVDKVSGAARKAIEDAGGSVVVD